VLTVQQENQSVFLKEQLIVIFSRLKRLVGIAVKVLCARYAPEQRKIVSG